jgi:hypothetical protein
MREGHTIFENHVVFFFIMDVYNLILDLEERVKEYNCCCGPNSIIQKQPKNLPVASTKIKA